MTLCLTGARCNSNKGGGPSTTTTTTTAEQAITFSYTVPDTGEIITVTNDSPSTYSEDDIRKKLAQVPMRQLHGMKTVTASTLFAEISVNVWNNLLTDDDRNAWHNIVPAGSFDRQLFTSAYNVWLSTWSTATYANFFNNLVYRDKALGQQWLFMAGVFADPTNHVFVAYDGTSSHGPLNIPYSMRDSSTLKIYNQLYTMVSDGTQMSIVTADGLTPIDNHSNPVTVAVPSTFFRLAVPGYKIPPPPSASGASIQGRIARPNNHRVIYVSPQSPDFYVSPLNPSVRARLTEEVNDLRKGKASVYRTAPGAVPHGFAVEPAKP